MTKLIAMLVLGLLALPIEGSRPNGGAKVYVTNSEGDNLTVIDAGTLKVVGDIKVGDRPHGVTPSPDGHLLYVSIEGTNELISLDTATDKVLARTEVGSTPNQITITRDGKYVFVPLRDAAALDVVDTAAFKAIDRIKVPTMPHNTYTSGDGKHIYLGTMSGSRICVIDAASHKIIREIAPGNWVRPMAIRRDESIAYVALSTLHGFAVVDLKAGNVIKRVELPALPPGTPKPFLDTYTHGLALTPDERELYVTSVPGNAVYAFSVPDLQRIAKIDVGKNPNWIAVHPDGGAIFVTNSADNTVSAIDTNSKKVVATIPVGHAPKRIIVVKPG